MNEKKPEPAEHKNATSVERGDAMRYGDVVKSEG